MEAGNGETARRYPLRVPGWEDVPHLVHGFLGREHDLPAGRFGARDLVRVLTAAGERAVVVLAARQVHGSVVLAPEDLEVCGRENAAMPADLPAGDALVSASADVLLTIRTADCAPILLVAPRARAVAAVHAGWRGLLEGVVARAIEALHDRYDARPDEICAAIGPSIGGCCYEFGAEHRDAFRAAFGPPADAAWLPGRGDRPHLELRTMASAALTAAGVRTEAIAIVGPCTAEHPGELHSYRRDGPKAGRQISYVGWSSASRPPASAL
jgi:YfiH family protein